MSKNQSNGAVARDVRQNALRTGSIVALLVTVGAFLWQLPHFLAGNSTVWPQYANAFGDMLFYTAWTAAVLLLLTALTRTVSIWTLVTVWFLGVFAVHGLVVALGQPFVASMGTRDVGIWVAPVVETLVVLVVIVGFYALATFRRGTHPSVSDGLLVGFATGAGLAFHEDMTYGRVMAIGPGAEYTVVGRTGQDIWWSYVFPLVGWQGLFNIRQFGNGLAGNFALYHAGWATLVGVGVGLIFVHRRRILAWLAGLFVVAVTYFDHMGGNWGVYNPNASAPIVGDLFTGGDTSGASELAVYILLVAIAGAIAVDLLVLRRTSAAFDAFPSVADVVRRDRRDEHGPGGVPAVRRTLARLGYARYRRAVLFALYRAAGRDEVPEPLERSLYTLDGLGERAGVWRDGETRAVDGGGTDGTSP